MDANGGDLLWRHIDRASCETEAHRQHEPANLTRLHGYFPSGARLMDPRGYSIQAWTEQLSAAVGCITKMLKWRQR
jgi:hypothetical protein